MTSPKSKFQSVLWFLRRPPLYREFFRRTCWWLLGSGEDERQKDAEDWCRRQALPTHEALRRLGCAPTEHALFAKHGELLRRAEEVASQGPKEMGGAGDLELLYALTRSLRAARVVETGVSHGWSSLAILLALKDGGRGTLVSTDMPYVQMDFERFVGLVVGDDLRRAWTLIRLPDRDALPAILRSQAPIDLCHYDSDKSYRGRMWAYPRLWDALRPGGFLVSDDIGDNMGFRDFSARIGVEPIVVNSEFGGLPKFVGILAKPF